MRPKVGAASFNNPNVRYSLEQVLQVINLLRNTNLTFKQIAEEARVNVNLVGEIRRGENWTEYSGGYIYRPGEVPHDAIAELPDPSV